MPQRYSSEFTPFINDFEKNCKIKVILPIELADLPKDTLGRCNNFKTLIGGLYLPQEFRSIEINRAYWKKASFFDKESTILHEFGHCILNIEHDTSWIGESILTSRPKSIMYPYTFPQYSTYRYEYRKQLFSNCK